MCRWWVDFGVLASVWGNLHGWTGCGVGGFRACPACQGGFETRPYVASRRGAVHNLRHSGESRNPEGLGNGEAHMI